MQEILYQAYSGLSFSYNPSPLTLGALAYLALFLPVVVLGLSGAPNAGDELALPDRAHLRRSGGAIHRASPWRVMPLPSFLRAVGGAVFWN